MFMDADNEAFSTNGKSKFSLSSSVKNQLNYDSYDVQMRSSVISYNYPWLVRINPDKKWKWYKRRHEYPAPDGNWVESKLRLVADMFIQEGKDIDLKINIHMLKMQVNS